VFGQKGESDGNMCTRAEITVDLKKNELISHELPLW
jgi:hypothetical protein